MAAKKKTKPKAAKPKVAITKATFARLEEIVSALPEAFLEKIRDHYAVKVGEKTFAWQQNDHHGDGRVALVVKAEKGLQGALVQSDPKRFFVPAYVGKSGWVGMRLEGRPNWKAVEQLLVDAYLLVAAKKLGAALR